MWRRCVSLSNGVCSQYGMPSLLGRTSVGASSVFVASGRWCSSKGAPTPPPPPPSSASTGEPQTAPAKEAPTASPSESGSVGEKEVPSSKPQQPSSGSSKTASSTQSTTPSSEAAGHENYRIPTDKILQAVRAGNFNAMQTHAADIVQHKWKEEYSVPAACVFIILVMWYWMSSTVRRARRSCAASEAKVKEEAEQTREYVRGIVAKWEAELRTADGRLQSILEKNSDLTKDIDRMTSALKTCSIKPTGPKHIIASMEKTE